MADPDPIAELIRLLARLPGIGERSAGRLVFHLLAGDAGYAEALGGALGALHERIKRCVECGNFGAAERCSICQDARRDDSVLCVVARVPDLHAIERSGSFRGRYHVLHRLLAPLDGVGPADLPLDALVERVRRHGTREVIVATPLNVEGEATALFVAQVLASEGVTVSRIASGMPHGSELEFTDQVTLGRALSGRRSLS